MHPGYTQILLTSLAVTRSCWQEQTAKIPPYHFLNTLVQNCALFHRNKSGKKIIQWPNNDYINIGLANMDLKTYNNHSQNLRWVSWLQNIRLPAMGLLINTYLWLQSTFITKYFFSLLDAWFNELLNAEGGVSPSQDVIVAMRIYPVVSSSWENVPWSMRT